ncbi:MAG: ISKra4 family transposase, partial [Chroococcidiopsidaceae cyanobacterium CP_BM_RX_35]|nr:ISKra4 family transposase [Chroococcidiopsidaceae cyanobacterium CP_BM_RX_35]
MDYEFRVVIEKVSVSNQKVVKRDTLKIYDIQKPESILDLGLRHEEQISLLSKVQSAFLAEQSLLIDSGFRECPKCGAKLSKYGFMQSKFHAVFSDHKLRMQKHRCQNPDCNWQSTPTTSTVFGTDTHPDLAKLQCEQGVLHSYRKAQDNLDKLNCQRRSVNNHVQIQHLTNQVGARLSQENQLPPSQAELPVPAEELIVQVDGGHIPTKEQGKRSFEAVSAVIYRPSCLEFVDQYHYQITDKSCVISALDDDLKTIKTYLHHAALKQGLSQQTRVTALADGANNCWSVISVLEPHCQTIEPILAWFHIAKKFQNVKSALGEACTESIESAKWTLWHGEAEETLRKIALIRDNITEQKQRSKLKGLQDYLENNLDYLVNYSEREKTNQVFTSQVAESHIDTIINARHKRKQK